MMLDQDLFHDYHTNQGSQLINLDSAVPEEIELEPAEDTTYYCKLYQGSIMLNISLNVQPSSKKEMKH